MPISKTILPEFDHEMANTRKTLERVPDDKFSWKPHEKSMTLGGLSTHLANIPSWTICDCWMFRCRRSMDHLLTKAGSSTNVSTIRVSEWDKEASVV